MNVVVELPPDTREMGSATWVRDHCPAPQMGSSSFTMKETAERKVLLMRDDNPLPDRIGRLRSPVPSNIVVHTPVVVCEGLRVGEPVREPLEEAVELGVDDTLGVELTVGVCVPLDDCVTEGDCETLEDCVVLGLCVALGVCVPLRVPVTL